MKTAFLRTIGLSAGLAALPAAGMVFAETAAIADPATLTEVVFVDDVGAAERIRAADRLRTLTQEVAAAACLFGNGQLPDLNRKLLVASIDEIDLLLDALLHGNDDLHIVGAERRKKTIREIEMIIAEWTPLRDAAQQVLVDVGNTAALHQIYDATPHFFYSASHLLSELEGEYAHPTLILFEDVMLLEFAGRQAMITQKIAYESCLVWSGYGTQEHRDDLKVITDQFDLIARALHDGMPSLGIQAAPTDDIRIGLEDVIVDWDEVRSHLTDLINGGAGDAADIIWISEAMTKKMYKMEDIVLLYAEYSRRALF